MDKPKATDERDDLASVGAIVDRRRPGRIEYWNPFLITLLRRDPAVRSDRNEPQGKLEDDDEEVGYRLPLGIAVACIAAISLLLWALICTGLWLVVG